jgi:hypothetical protein
MVWKIFSGNGIFFLIIGIINYTLMTRYTKEGKMATRPIPVKMTDKVRYELRLMAAASDRTMGDLIGVLVQSLRSRVERYRKEYGITEGFMHLDSVINLILKKDLGEITAEEFRQGISNLEEVKPSVRQRRKLIQ